jgi:hypothetical protein
MNKAGGGEGTTALVCDGDDSSCIDTANFCPRTSRRSQDIDTLTRQKGPAFFHGSMPHTVGTRTLVLPSGANVARTPPMSRSLH